MFTDNKATIRKKTNAKFEPGKRGLGESAEQYDFFNTEGFFVYYDENENVTAFEFFEGDLFLEGVNILTLPYNSLVKHLATMDPDLHIEYNGFTSYNCGIGGNTNDDPNDPAALIEAIIVFKPGYYD